MRSSGNEVVTLKKWTAGEFVNILRIKEKDIIQRVTVTNLIDFLNENCIFLSLFGFLGHQNSPTSFAQLKNTWNECDLTWLNFGVLEGIIGKNINTKLKRTVTTDKFRSFPSPKSIKTTNSSPFETMLKILNGSSFSINYNWASLSIYFGKLLMLRSIQFSRDGKILKAHIGSLVKISSIFSATLTFLFFR